MRWRLFAAEYFFTRLTLKHNSRKAITISSNSFSSVTDASSSSSISYARRRHDSPSISGPPIQNGRFLGHPSERERGKRGQCRHYAAVRRKRGDKTGAGANDRCRGSVKTYAAKFAAACPLHKIFFAVGHGFLIGEIGRTLLPPFPFSTHK